MTERKRVLVVGLGNMGMSHALAYTRIHGFEVVGVCERRVAQRVLPPELANVRTFADFDTALSELRPEIVSINTQVDTHAPFAIKAMKAGAHVFVEKPVAETVADALEVVDTARTTNRKLLVGYILRHHPSWIKFIDLARGVGSPYVFRMNLNQQSSGPEWAAHKRLMKSMSPIVDCGVHYVDVWCQITKAKPLRVHALGARLSDEIAPGMYNYGHFQVSFDDGSVGWYEAGWGPMMSETAFFIKDVIGPNGSVSIAMTETMDGVESSGIDQHTKTNRIRVHHADLDTSGAFKRCDDLVDTSDEPGHDDLCEWEQRYLLNAIDNDVDLSEHMEDCVKSLRIVLAADQSVRTGQIVAIES
ncbi:Gfo/Idh/MocA family protein [Microvirga brassicacearum]|uniref:Gfo/Idh/MocA family oxidoreductase n=1 Tax=Microvirga brassicacearum TaxID=2580413 RepID=A0A5N3P4K6_9HYPH|nr:Gfo/Idh/MocA family oxidoreductase [Microvirga brassicacearum]KAB0264652.1 Gfo/Idh/MocA family oxidoreductase [Microvirga brassicacearum]